MKEFNILASSFLYFTRVKFPFKVPYDKDHMVKALTWFPIVGLLVGAFGAGLWWLASLVLPNEVAIVLSMVGTVLLTGGFHEDGMADVCDGFGGGYGKDRILAIMKDSSTGAYGAIGLVLVLLMKFITLSHITAPIIFVSMIVGHVLSRSMTLLISQRWHYVRSSDSKGGLLSQRLSSWRFILVLIMGLVSVLFVPLPSVWILPLAAVVTAYILGSYFCKHIGGYTGDCLGATQQVIEVVIYLAILIIQ